MSAAPGDLLMADTLLVRTSIGTIFLRMAGEAANVLLEVSPEEALCTARVLRDAAREALNQEAEFAIR